MCHFYPPTSKANREVANLIERKNPHTSVYGVKEFVYMSVTNFDPNYAIIKTVFLGWSQILNTKNYPDSHPSQGGGGGY